MEAPLVTESDSMTTVKDYRRATAKRQKAWRDRQQELGRRQTNVWLESEAWEALEKRAAESGGSKVDAYREIISNLLISGVTNDSESDSIQELQAKLEAAEAEAFKWRQDFNWSEDHRRQLQEQVEHYQCEAVKVAEKNGHLIAEITELKRRISELESQGKATPKGKPVSLPEPSQVKPAAAVSDLPEALFDKDREAKKQALLELADQAESRGETFTALAQRLNQAGVSMLKGPGRWNTKNLFQAIDRIRKERQV